MPDHLPLGRTVDYPRDYDPSLLFPIARALGRADIGLGAAADAPLPFTGLDRWHAYELSWLDARGRPHVATATLEVPADSPNLVESKSLKLYLNSFNATRVASREELRERIVAELSRVAGAPVRVAFGLPAMMPELQAADSDGSLDTLDIDVDCYGPPDASLLHTHAGEPVRETLTSALLKSNCPVTGQPDWAQVVIDYHGPRLDPAGLLRYLVSFRDHAEFHEQCVERIHTDLMARLQPRALGVEARYTRRGGLDINPWRATPGMATPRWVRDERQ